MKIVVLFDGAGLARLGLEQAGHECTGYELDPSKHYLSKFVGSGNCVLQDATTVDLSPYDAIWASPPCQYYSDNNITGNTNKFGDSDLLKWSLGLIDKYPNKIIWVENVFSRRNDNSWGNHYNACQFLEVPIQQRKRIIGGNYTKPQIFRKFQHSYPKLNVCPAIMAGEYKTTQTTINKWLVNNKKIVFSKAAKWYKRPLQLEDCSYHQGFEIPLRWFIIPENWNSSNLKWKHNLYTAIGNGVPVYMAKAFGDVYK